MCLQSKGGGHVPFTVTAAGQVYKQTVEFVYMGGAISADWDLRSVEVTRRIQRAWACFGRYKMEIYDRPSVFTPEGADAESRGSGDAINTTVCTGVSRVVRARLTTTGYRRSTTR